MITLVVAWGQHHHRIMPGLSSFPTIHQIQIPAESNTRNIFFKESTISSLVVIHTFDHYTKPSSKRTRHTSKMQTDAG